MVEHADHITHSIYQRLVRERDIPGLQRAVTRAAHRFPEIRDFFIVFYEYVCGRGFTDPALLREKPEPVTCVNA